MVQPESGVRAYLGLFQIQFFPRRSDSDLEQLFFSRFITEYVYSVGMNFYQPGFWIVFTTKITDLSFISYVSTFVTVYYFQSFVFEKKKIFTFGFYNDIKYE